MEVRECFAGVTDFWQAYEFAGRYSAHLEIAEKLCELARDLEECVLAFEYYRRDRYECERQLEQTLFPKWDEAAFWALTDPSLGHYDLIELRKRTRIPSQAYRNLTKRLFVVDQDVIEALETWQGCSVDHMDLRAAALKAARDRISSVEDEDEVSDAEEYEASLIQGIPSLLNDVR